MNRHSWFHRIILRPVLAAMLVAALCHPVQASLTVASLSTVTTDLARQIGGTNVRVVPIIGSGIDPHAFEPTPADVKKVSDADLVLFTGKGMEGYLTKLEDASGNPSKFVDVGQSIPTLTMTEDGTTAPDPHWWQSVENMKIAAQSVKSSLAAADPSHAADYRANTTAYLAQLDELERWIRVTLAALPRSKRKLVTSHDSLGYFARDHSFVIHPVKGISTSEEPSSQNVRDIIGVINREGVKAVFFESIENPKAIDQISRESGAKPGGTLYTDGLGSDSESTYVGMMRHNVTTIVEGLK
jgi:zinc/manganese transport system substrate-binding protein